MMSYTTFSAFTLSLVLAQAPSVSSFTPMVSKPSHIISSATQLRYRSLHHGPDVEPLSEEEKLGSEFTKMSKDNIYHYGPGDFTQYIDSQGCDVFDGGDSEMGLSGDGNIGLSRFGCDVSPHMARTLTAKTDQPTAPHMSYADELLQANPSMDAVRAQQLANWATQNEIAMSNRYMNSGSEYHQGSYISDHVFDNTYEDEAMFSSGAEAGDYIEGIIALKAPMYGVAAQEIMLKNPYMGYAKFRAAFVGDVSNEWSVTPDDGFLKQHEETGFIVRYNPCNPGVSSAHLVIETEDFKKTWKVVGSTGEYEF